MFVYINSWRGIDLGFLCLYEYVAIIVIVPIKKEQKSQYGFITQSQIDELPTSTPEEVALKKRMESLLESHLAFLTAKKQIDEMDIEEDSESAEKEHDSISTTTLITILSYSTRNRIKFQRT